MSNKLGWFGGMSVVLGLWAAFVVRFWWVCDDAFISFRYGRNLARGDGLRYNLGDHTPVEGFSNLLWVLVEAGLFAMGFDVPQAVPWVSAACGVALIVGLARVCVSDLGMKPRVALMAVAFAAWMPSMAVWATSGLETMPFTLAVFALTVLLCVRERPGLVAVLLSTVALVTLRTEGFAWVGVIAVAAAWSGAVSDASRRKALGVAVVTAVLLTLALQVGRFLWFGTLVANTTLVKGRIGAYSLSNGVPYLVAAAATLPTAVVGFIVAGWGALRERKAQALLGVALAFPAFALLVGGDHFAYFRLLVPALPLVALGVGVALNGIGNESVAIVVGGVLALGGFPAATGFDLVPDDYADRVHFRGPWEQAPSELRHWKRQADSPPRGIERGRIAAQLGLPKDTSWVVYAVGARGWASDLFMLDANGLVTRSVAEQPFATGPITPGHGKRVERGFFLDQGNVGIYSLNLVDNKPRAIRRAIRSKHLSPTDKARLRPAVYPVDDRQVALVLHGLAEGEDAEHDWAEIGAAKKALDGHWSRQAAQPDITDQLDALGYVDGEEAAPVEVFTVRHRPGAVDGRNLYVSGHLAGATLAGMDGRPLHQWAVPFETAFPDARHLENRTQTGHWRRAKPVGEDGSLVALHEFLGILRVRADSTVVWSQANGAHHDFFIHDGEVWTLTRKSGPRPGWTASVHEDFVTVLDLETGETVREFSVLDALRDSPFAADAPITRQAGDLMHTNTLWRIDGPAAQESGPFARGNLMLSSRPLSLVFVVDPDTEKTVWTLTGPFLHQHDPELMADGSILLFDNHGVEGRSRVVRLDTDGQIRWEWGSPSSPLFSRCCGTVQPLGDHLLVVETTGGRALELDANDSVVWEFVSPHRAPSDPTLVASLFDVIRMPPDYGDDWIDPTTVPVDP